MSIWIIAIGVALITVVWVILRSPFGIGLASFLLNKFHYWYRVVPVFHTLGRLFADNKKSSSLPPLDDFERVSSRTVRVLGLNPGTHTLQGTNTWLVTGTETNEHILIDTGEDVTCEKYVRFLFDEIFPQTKTSRLTKILLTHGHADHQGGVIAILRELKRRNMLPLPTIHKRNVINGQFPAKSFECQHIQDGDQFNVDAQTTIEAVYTPGHTDDHVAFVLIEDGAILTGDCVLGCGTAVFDNLKDYMHSLQMLRRIMTVTYPHVDTIYPGHGPVIHHTAVAKIDEYVDHRNKREASILSVMRTAQLTKLSYLRTTKMSAAKCWTSSWQLTQDVYGPLQLFVKFSAQHNLTHHLEKLRSDGVVETRWPDMWALSQRHNSKSE